MPSKNKNKARQVDTLQEELFRLQQELRSKRLCSQDRDAQIVALLRLCENMDKDVWKKISEQTDLSSWITLPLEGKIYPTLIELQNRLNELEFEKDHDVLTSLPNKRMFERRLDMEMDRCIRFKTPLSLCIMDIDNFKLFNDNYGHICGDMILRSLAGILTAQIRSIDLPARIGGEEFAVIFPGTGMVKSKNILNRLKINFSKTTVTCSNVKETLGFTCSMGLACFKAQKRISKEELIKAADQAMYQAKQNGKNQIANAPLLGTDKKRKDATLVRLEEKKFLFSGNQGQE